jgi:hypothetical protein
MEAKCACHLSRKFASDFDPEKVDKESSETPRTLRGAGKDLNRPGRFDSFAFLPTTRV